MLSKLISNPYAQIAVASFVLAGAAKLEQNINRPRYLDNNLKSISKAGLFLSTFNCLSYAMLSNFAHSNIFKAASATCSLALVYDACKDTEFASEFENTKIFSVSTVCFGSMFLGACAGTLAYGAVKGASAAISAARG